MAAQLVQVVLDVAQGDLPAAGVEHVEGEQLGGLDHAHGTDRRPAVVGLSSNTPLCLAAVSRPRESNTRVW